MIKFLVYMFLLFSLSGCGVKNIDKPPPPWWKDFSKDNMSEYEIKKALLECGSNLPGEANEFADRGISDSGFNERVLIKKCMKESGFKLKTAPDAYCYPNRKDPVTGEPYPACNANAEIPKRSVEVRLKSPYCKIYPKSSYCVP